MKVTVYLTHDGAIARKAHCVGVYGSEKALSGHGTLLRSKLACRAMPVESYLVQTTCLPDWQGDLKERAAVGLGHRKAFARFITSVEPLI